HDVILPGSKIVMRAADGHVFQTLTAQDGVEVVDLRDDVRTLRSFSFRLPSALAPKLYDLYLLMNGTEVKVGSLSYTLPGGRSIGLPNYPPQVIGGAYTRGDILFV